MGFMSTVLKRFAVCSLLLLSRTSVAGEQPNEVPTRQERARYQMYLTPLSEGEIRSALSGHELGPDRELTPYTGHIEVFLTNGTWVTFHSGTVLTAYAGVWRIYGNQVCTQVENGRGPARGSRQFCRQIWRDKTSGMLAMFDHFSTELRILTFLAKRINDEEYAGKTINGRKIPAVAASENLNASPDPDDQRISLELLSNSEIKTAVVRARLAADPKFNPYHRNYTEDFLPDGILVTQSAEHKRTKKLGAWWIDADQLCTRVYWTQTDIAWAEQTVCGQVWRDTLSGKIATFDPLDSAPSIVVFSSSPITE